MDGIVACVPAITARVAVGVALGSVGKCCGRVAGHAVIAAGAPVTIACLALGARSNQHVRRLQ